MKFLLDTNIFIPLETTREADLDRSFDRAAELVRLLQEARHNYFVHPAIHQDFARDPDLVRRRLRDQQIRKYQPLPEPPAPSAAMKDAFGVPVQGSNDWVDLQHLAAVERDAVDYLVTEDRGLRQRAMRLGFDDRVCTLDQAAQVVLGLSSKPRPPPAPTRRVHAHSLDEADPIFETIRRDYGSSFDGWLQKCKRDHRQCIVIDGGGGGLAAIAILKEETADEHGLGGVPLKICTFKVSSRHLGQRFGELLLKAVFEYAEERQRHLLYVTVFDKQVELTALFAEFGFSRTLALGGAGDPVWVKHLRPDHEASTLEPLEFNKRFGPRSVKANGVAGFVVPIQPKYHRLLFPEAEGQLQLQLAVHPFGNAIRKAYLCHSGIRRVAPGDLVLFYRSTTQEVVVLGVVEETFVSDQAMEIARKVGKRTVYSQEEIRMMALAGSVLTVLFRQSRVLPKALTLDVLRKNEILSSHPQSIVTIPERGVQWLAGQLGELY